MEWNSGKFLALRMGSNSTLREDSLLFTPLTGDPIQEREEAKDLGVIMDNIGDFRVQRAKANARTRQKAGWVLWTFKTRELTPMRALWKSLVRPHQDYASQLWAPVGLTRDLAAQEAPLRAFTRKIRGLGSLPYWERLSHACLLSTERRMERYRILYAWKSLKGLVPECGLSVDSSPDSRRGRTLTVPPITGSVRSVQSLREQSFQYEAPRLFNSLPASLRNADTTLATFKANLDCFLSVLPDQPKIPGYIPGAADITGKPSNSIKDWTRSLLTNTWSVTNIPTSSPGLSCRNS